VEEELWEIWDYIAKDNPDAAAQVIAATREMFKTLARNPGLGKPRAIRKKRILGIFVRPVAGFDRYLVFYRKVTDGIQVIHVLHDARKIDRFFPKR
jgi:toxin ParE1/3/4